MNYHAKFISDQEVEKALDFLRDEAATLGDLTREARKSEHMTKHIMALEMKRFVGSAAAQEREARSSDAFLRAIDAESFAAGELAKAKALREAAALKIEVWRSQQANYRAMKV